VAEPLRPGPAGTFTVGSITVFIALMNAPNAEPDALASLTKIWSGGAPIPPSTV
jgi:long-chain acyl-CoA synthetase